jgi:hypothetical protein
MLALGLLSCKSGTTVSCELPPLDEASVTRIANEYLVSRNMNEAFRLNAERRITEVGCRYLYEEAEKLDSFGVGIVVEIDRAGKVVGFRSTE